MKVSGGSFRLVTALQHCYIWEWLTWRSLLQVMMGNVVNTYLYIDQYIDMCVTRPVSIYQSRSHNLVA